MLNRRILGSALAAWIALGAALGAFTHGDLAGMGIGWALAGLLSALSFGALLWVRKRALQDLMIVIVGGFLLRMLVVGLTLVLMLRADADPLRFALGFFSAYLLLQLFEVLWLNTQGKQPRREVSA